MEKERIILSDIRKNLKDAIKQSGFTQKELAELIGVKQPQISCYIGGKKMPALDTFANLCVILAVDPADILCTKKF